MDCLPEMFWTETIPVIVLLTLMGITGIVAIWKSL